MLTHLKCVSNSLGTCESSDDKLDNHEINEIK